MKCAFVPPTKTFALPACPASNWSAANQSAADSCAFLAAVRAARRASSARTAANASPAWAAANASAVAAALARDAAKWVALPATIASS